MLLAGFEVVVVGSVVGSAAASRHIEGGSYYGSSEKVFVCSVKGKTCMMMRPHQLFHASSPRLNG